MEYKTYVIINRPIEKVIELMSDADNLKYWQDGLIRFETFEGKQGEVGAKSRLTYDINGREMFLIETITVNNMPHEFSGIYEAPGVITSVKNYFTKIDDNTTKYESVNDYKATNLMMKIMVLFMPGVFRKQCDELLQSFKKFAESRD